MPKIDLLPGEVLLIGVAEGEEGTIEVKLTENELSVVALLADSDGVEGKIYSERFGDLVPEVADEQPVSEESLANELQQRFLVGVPLELTEASQAIADLRAILEGDCVFPDGTDVSGDVYWNDDRSVVVYVPPYATFPERLKAAVDITEL